MHSFWFHYNKPETQRAGSPKISVHYRGQCHIVDSIVCRVPITSRSRSRQPRLVIAGRGVVRFQGSLAVVTEV